jgi:methyl-accepting chemotaxis protein
MGLLAQGGGMSSGDIVSLAASVLGIVVIAWAVGSLALIERLRKTFATPKEIEEMEGRLSQQIRELKKDVTDFEDLAENKLVTRAEVDGVGSRVGNLEHMFTAVQGMAQEAKEVARESQAEIKNLREDIVRMDKTTNDTNQKLDRLLESFIEVRTALKIHLGPGALPENNREG